MRRVAVLRGFAAAVRDGVLAAPAVARFAAVRFAGDLRVPDDRLAPLLADFARVDADFAAAPREVDARFVVRFADDLRAPDFAALPRDEEDELPVLAEPSIDHLPDITRCAASATASAMIDPSLVALEAMALAACDAVSAASSPASRIFLRAAGLALIAAAAAARPAASISLLIAAFASLSILSLDPERDDDELEPDDVDREELLRVDLAIASSPSVCRERHFKAVPVP